jgi:hypothetical protein
MRQIERNYRQGSFRVERGLSWSENWILFRIMAAVRPDLLAEPRAEPDDDQG